MTAVHQPAAEESGAEKPERGTGWIASKIPLVVTIALAIVLHLEMGDMRIGTLTDSGPGFWPRLLFIGIILTSVAGFVTDMKEGIEPFALEGTARVGLGFLTLVLFTLLFEHTGVILAGMVMLLLWLKGLNGESWRLALVISLIAPILAYLLFVTVLGVPFPADMIASLWGGR